MAVNTDSQKKKNFFFVIYTIIAVYIVYIGNRARQKLSKTKFTFREIKFCSVHIAFTYGKWYIWDESFQQYVYLDQYVYWFLKNFPQVILSSMFTRNPRVGQSTITKVGKQKDILLYYIFVMALTCIQICIY